MTTHRSSLLVCASILCLLIWASTAGVCSQTFQDVPADHWAAESVETLAQADILNGYPDGTYRGDKPVTRYELAVALEAMIEFIRRSREPIIEESKTSVAPPAHWAQRSMKYLQTGTYLPSDSFIFQQPSAHVSVQQLGEALAFVSARLISLETPAASHPPL